MRNPVGNAGRRVLLVDSDPASSQALASELARSGGIAVETASDAGAALRLTGAVDFDLVIGAPPWRDMAPEELVRRLREVRSDLPVLLLVPPDAGTAANGEVGPDEVMTRPVRLGALLERVGALLDRRGHGGPAIGPYELRRAEKLLISRSGDRQVRLTEKEVAILDYLARAGDRATTRELLLNEVWGYNSGVATHTLETHIYRLRRKIEADPANAEILVSEPGGYRLAGG